MAYIADTWRRILLEEARDGSSEAARLLAGSIADALESHQLDAPAQCYLVQALRAMAEGQSADVALCLKGKRGKPAGLFDETRMQNANIWLQIVSMKEENPGLTLQEAKANLADETGQSEDVIHQRYYRFLKGHPDISNPFKRT